MSRPRIIAVLLVLAAVYCGSYLYLTLRGTYQPVTVGLNGRNTYAWAPQGFVEDFHWNRFKIAFFAPLYGLDLRFWHSRDRASTGLYPINAAPTLVPTKPL